jgi:hypothetical protein
MSEVIETGTVEGPNEAERQAHYEARRELEMAARQYLNAKKALDDALIEMEGAKEMLGEAWKKADCPEGMFKIYFNYQDNAVELKGDATQAMPDVKLHTLENF